DRSFQLEFVSHLERTTRSASQPGSSGNHRGRGQQYVLDVAAAMFAWAADRERGNLLPAGFVNPFAKRLRKIQTIAIDLIRPLDITVTMAIGFIEAADQFQLRVF